MQHKGPEGSLSITNSVQINFIVSASLEP
ncbi:hypothetical protein EMIT0324P_30075 [Pseudomonas chlororaphis]